MILSDSILKTIAFFDLFEFPLTAPEIKDHLYQFDRPLHIKEVEGTLRQMMEEGKLEAIKDYFVLKNRTNLVETRKTRKFIAEKLWNRVKLYSAWMQRMPFIRMIAVCNNLSTDNVDEKSDIDLFVVAEPGHLWTARFFMTCLLHFFGVRRHGSHIAGRFCLSFFMTTNKLNIGELQISPEDPYLAYWTQTLTPIYGESMYEEFKKVNGSWLKESYGLFFLDFARRHLYFLPENRFKQFLEKCFGNWFETLLKKTLKKKTLESQQKLGPNPSVIVSDDILKFHNEDRRQEFLEKWKIKFDSLQQKT